MITKLLDFLAAFVLGYISYSFVWSYERFEEVANDPGLWLAFAVCTWSAFSLFSKSAAVELFLKSLGRNET